MSTPLPIIGYHIVFGAYGFWLPNDPAGSWSRCVWAQRLQRFGPPRPLSANHERAGGDSEVRDEMQLDLRFPAVRFSGRQALAAARGMAEIIRRLQLVVYATAIMPDHVHVACARQEMWAEDIAANLKRAGSRQLRKESLHPLAAWPDKRGRFPSPWEAKGWKAFLHTPEEMAAAIAYVNNNPIEAGLKPQRWSWIKPYEP